MRLVLKHVHRVKVRGKVYYYHRPTKTRLPGEPGSPEFMAAYTKASAKPENGLPGTFRALADAYLRSREFADLAPRTKRDYRQVLDYLDKRIGNRMADDITPASLMIARDGIAEARNWRFANYCLSVIGRVYSVNVLRGRCKTNPTTGIKAFQRPKSAPQVNRPWTDHEIDAVLAAAPAPIALAVAIGAWTGLREGDVIRLPWSAYKDGYIDTKQGKTGDPVWVPVHSRVRAMLDATKKRGPIIVMGERGKPYTSDGFRTVFYRLIAKLKAERKIGDGLTFHGLRHTVATKLADAGADTKTIMAVTGHKTYSVAEKYIKTADRKKRATAAIALIDTNESGTETVKRPDFGVKSGGKTGRLKP